MAPSSYISSWFGGPSGAIQEDDRRQKGYIDALKIRVGRADHGRMRWIEGLQVKYQVVNSEPEWGQEHNDRPSSDSHEDTLELGAKGRHIVQISGKAGEFIQQLTFDLSDGSSYTYGDGSEEYGSPQAFIVPKGHDITSKYVCVGFNYRVGDMAINAIRVIWGFPPPSQAAH